MLISLMNKNLTEYFGERLNGNSWALRKLRIGNISKSDLEYATSRNEEMINTAVISGAKMIIHFLQLSLLLNNIFSTVCITVDRQRQSKQ